MTATIYGAARQNRVAAPHMPPWFSEHIPHVDPSPPLLAATFLLSAAATAAQTEPAATQTAPPPHAPAPPHERLRVGLSDPDTKLVLPWFVTTLTDAVNQGKSANETGKALLDGL